MALRHAAAALLAMAGSAAIASELTEIETRWLRQGWPALAYAHQQGLPVDIVVLPRARPGDAPLAMAFAEGRCKLVLAMRGNPQAESAIDAIPPSLGGAAVEAMMAHELAHCWRHVNGHWHSLPVAFTAAAAVGATGGLAPGDAGFRSAAADTAPDAATIALWRAEMHGARREEGFADLVGLAWTQRRHPHLYADVHAWFTGLRADQPVAGAHHDTRAWLRLAVDPRAFTDAPTPFESVEALWTHGLSSADDRATKCRDMSHTSAR